MFQSPFINELVDLKHFIIIDIEKKVTLLKDFLVTEKRTGNLKNRLFSKHVREHVYRAKWNQTGNLIATAGEDKNAKIIEVGTEKVLFKGKVRRNGIATHKLFFSNLYFGKAMEVQYVSYSMDNEKAFLSGFEFFETKR